MGRDIWRKIILPSIWFGRTGGQQVMVVCSSWAAAGAFGAVAAALVTHPGSPSNLTMMAAAAAVELVEVDTNMMVWCSSIFFALPDRLPLHAQLLHYRIRKSPPPPPPPLHRPETSSNTSLPPPTAEHSGANIPRNFIGGVYSKTIPHIFLR